MKLVIQRVNSASVDVDGQNIASIGKGILVLVGIGKGDTIEAGNWLAKKLCNLRIFEDNNGKMNQSIIDVGGEILLVSQFTLYADCTRGRRPGFDNAAKPSEALEKFDLFCEQVGNYGIKPEKGLFGADMKVALVNDGPVTIILEK